MPRIFVSYRIDDSAAYTDRISDPLRKFFGQENVFKDIDSILPGSDWRRILRDELGRSDLLVVVIGRRWLNIVDEAGRRRLEAPEDFVRFEVETALDRKIPIMPLLVNGAALPKPGDLPESIRRLADFQAARVRRDPDFQDDMERVVRSAAQWLMVKKDGTTGIESTGMLVVPKGLRSFDEHDSGFFLSLLPGPRRSDGLPESVHFWKVRIEETDPDQTFAVGVIFGPSGSGKSSFVKAGFLPQLDESVAPIYVEATDRGTDARLIGRIRRDLAPDLPERLDLVGMLSALKDGRAATQRKVLLLIDQFEQWLHAQPSGEDAGLLPALRLCDGERLQALLLVREEYLGALLRSLKIDLRPALNCAEVGPFGEEHSRSVLTAFGRGYGRLPAPPEEPTPEQVAFVERAVAELGTGGKVICVHIALFADMVRERPWTAVTLDQVGGAQGVGVAFLEESFGSSLYRRHEKAARGVLEALLPQIGTDIKGHMQPRPILLEASRYGARPEAFDELIRILNDELRLITPTEPEVATPDHADGLPDPSSTKRYYQLTHDYLVPQIRKWLDLGLERTWRGRAKLQLARLSDAWKVRRESRYLPNVGEWVWFLVLTRSRSELQREMLRAAGRHYMRRALWLTPVLVVALVSVGWYIRTSESIKTIRQVISICYRRAVFTRFHAQLDPEAMFASLAECRVALQPLVTYVEPEDNQQLVAKIIADLDSLERIHRQHFGSYHYDEVTKAEINSVKLRIIHALSELAKSVSIPFDLPKSLTEETFFDKRAADAPPEVHEPPNTAL